MGHFGSMACKSAYAENYHVLFLRVALEEFFQFLRRHGLSVEIALSVITACHSEDLFLNVVLDALGNSFDLFGFSDTDDR